MPIDVTTLPIGGAALLAGAAYAVFAWALAGPEIATREIAREGWMGTCRSALQAEAEATRTRRPAAPQVPDLCGMMTGIDPALRPLCDFVPDPGAIMAETEARARAAEDARIAQASRGAADRCACAASVYIEENRLALALYAGSARLLTPSAVGNRDASLRRALRGPACRMEG